MIKKCPNESTTQVAVNDNANFYKSCSRLRGHDHTQMHRRPRRSNKKLVSNIMDRSCNYLNRLGDDKADVFRNTNCNYEDALKILFGWSLGIGLKELTEYFDTEECVVKYLYSQCTLCAGAYMRSNSDDWKIGGENVVVIIDVYPEGCKKFNYRRPQSNEKILCIAEVKDIPTKYWFEILDGPDEIDQALKTIEKVVRPNSTLVVDRNSSICFDKLKMQHPVIVSLDALERHDSDQQKVLKNLKTIWEPALQICENGSYHVDSLSYFTSYLWNQRFGNDGLRVLLEQF